MSKPQSFISSYGFQVGAGGLVGQGGLNEGVEQRVTIPWGGFEFRVELHAHVPWMNRLRQLHDFSQFFALGDSGNDQTGGPQLVQEVDVGFVAMAVAFGDDIAINLVGQGVRRDV